MPKIRSRRSDEDADYDPARDDEPAEQEADERERDLPPPPLPPRNPGDPQALRAIIHQRMQVIQAQQVSTTRDRQAVSTAMDERSEAARAVARANGIYGYASDRALTREERAFREVLLPDERHVQEFCAQIGDSRFDTAIDQVLAEESLYKSDFDKMHRFMTTSLATKASREKGKKTRNISAYGNNGSRKSNSGKHSDQTGKSKTPFKGPIECKKYKYKDWKRMSAEQQNKVRKLQEQSKRKVSSVSFEDQKENKAVNPYCNRCNSLDVS